MIALADIQVLLNTCNASLAAYTADQAALGVAVQEFIDAVPSTSVPAWVLNTFGIPVLDADYAGGQFFAGGQTYASEALLNAAAGGVTAGEARTFGPFTPNPSDNLFVNGDFSNGTTGWTGENGALISVVDGQLVLEANNGAGPRAQSGQATVPGTAYKFGGTRAGGTSPNTTALVSGANVWMNPLLQYTDLSGGTADAVESASSTTTYYGATISSTGSLGTLVMDNFTLVSVVPIPGMQPGQAAVQITATTPSSAVGTQVVFESGDASNANCIRLERRDDTHLHLVIYYGNPNAAQYDVDLGAITASTQFTVLLTAGVDTISYSLDGGARTYLQQTTIPPGMGILWAGRSWLGTIQRLTVWPTALPAAPFLVGYGDSLMYGTGATNFPGDTWQFKLDGFLGRRGSNQGIGGETSGNIADRFCLGIDNQGNSRLELMVQNVGGWGDPQTIYILEGGFNNHTAVGFTESDFKRMSDILDAVAARYLVMGIPTAEDPKLYTGGADRAAFDAINTNLLDVYGARFVNIDAALKAQSTHTGQDAVDDGHDIVPASQRADGVHWNNTGHLTVFNTMLAKIQSLGWEHIHERHRRAIGRTAKAAGYV